MGGYIFCIAKKYSPSHNCHDNNLGISGFYGVTSIKFISDSIRKGILNGHNFKEEPYKISYTV